MPDFHGPIQRVTLSGTLWLIVALPLLGALICAWRALAPVPEATRARTVLVSAGATSLAGFVSAYHAWALFRLPDGERFFLSHAWRMVRFGQLDAGVDLALDPLSAACTLLISSAGLALVLVAASPMRERGTAASHARFFAWLNGFVFAALVLVLADNFVLLFFGWEGVALASWGLVGLVWTDRAKASAGRRAFIVNRAADACLVLGIAFFYWGFGGAWVEGDYVPDLNARFSSVAVEDSDRVEGSAPAASPSSPSPDADRDDEDTERPPALATTGEGFLTLTSYPGAAVFMDDARAPMKGDAGQILRSPFVRLPVRGGSHSFRVHPGSGLDDFLVTHVAFGAGREVALAALGPTVTFREARDQLALRDVHGAASVRESLLAKRGLGGTALVTVASLFLLLAAAIKVAQLSLHAGLIDASDERARVAGLLHAGTLLIVSGYVLARVAFFLALSPPACLVVAVVGVMVALFFVATALNRQAVARVLGRLGTLSDHTLVAVAHSARDFTNELDGRLIGGAVDALGGLTRAFAWLFGRLDDDVVDGTVRALSTGVVRTGERMRLTQTARAHASVYGIVLGVLALALLQYWLR